MVARKICYAHEKRFGNSEKIVILKTDCKNYRDLIDLNKELGTLKEEETRKRLGTLKKNWELEKSIGNF
jgi:hypothetical protein